MTDLSVKFRDELKKTAIVSDVKVKVKQVSKDGTIKYLLEFPDGECVETVLMRFDNRANLTACVSSQVGCAVNCSFCATGKRGFIRNLSYKEIIEQVLTIQRDTGLKVTNVVFMGQGEPLLNLDNVLKAMEIFNESFQIGARRLTVSTSGIIPQIKKLAELINSGENDKKAYTLLIGMGGLQFPLARTILGDDYEAAPYAFVGWGVSALIYDETQGRFLLGETYSSEWQEIPFTDGCAFDMGNMEKDLVYMAQGYCDQNYAMYGYAVMETPGVPAERAVYVYTTAYNAAGTKGYAILDLAACNDIDEAAYWAFSTRSPSMYYATSTNIYLCNFNLTNWTVVPPTQPAWTCPAGEEITCMRLFSSSGLELKEDASCKYLLVGTYNGVEGKVYILGADVASGIITPEALEVYDGLGKIKDMQFKAQ